MYLYTLFKTAISTILTVNRRKTLGIKPTVFVPFLQTVQQKLTKLSLPKQTPTLTKLDPTTMYRTKCISILQLREPTLSKGRRNIPRRKGIEKWIY
mmetsp:Transcript_29998/g.64285  ORF Transcript_29998/g.64285 Transcript_29998/m.64285 type:complete len:96 (+) Transcript_29998:133-420(+)